MITTQEIIDNAGLTPWYSRVAGMPAIGPALKLLALVESVDVAYRKQLDDGRLAVIGAIARVITPLGSKPELRLELRNGVLVGLDDRLELIDGNVSDVLSEPHAFSEMDIIRPKIYSHLYDAYVEQDDAH